MCSARAWLLCEGPTTPGSAQHRACPTRLTAGLLLRLLLPRCLAASLPYCPAASLPCGWRRRQRDAEKHMQQARELRDVSGFREETHRGGATLHGGLGYVGCGARAAESHDGPAPGGTSSGAPNRRSPARLCCQKDLALAAGVAGGPQPGRGLCALPFCYTTPHHKGPMDAQGTSHATPRGGGARGVHWTGGQRHRLSYTCYTS